MSADNYFIIRKHPDGGYACLMGFMSDESIPNVYPMDAQYGSVEAALAVAFSDYAEYGVRIHPECDGDW